MGMVNKVINADYSQNAVGKYDFNTNIFRRKIGEKLERNYLALNSGLAYSTQPTNLSNDYVVVKSGFVFGNHSGTNHGVFSMADYNAKRSFNLSHSLSGTTLIIQMLVVIGENIFYGIYNTAAPAGLTSYECEYAIDFVNKSFGYAKINGVAVTFTKGTNTNTNAWKYGQTRTVCFGNLANYINNTIPSRAFPYFGQLCDNRGNILAHFDFLGDNNNEILTDKVSLTMLKQTSSVLIVSYPIDL